MKLINAIIVDDESRARRVLRNLLNTSGHNIKILSECSNLMEAIKEIKAIKPDVVFLDIEMPEFAGFEIVNYFDIIDFDIVFVTAYDSYAVKAFEVCAIDYLVKPIDRTRLKLALDKVEKNIKNKCNLDNYEVLMQSIKRNKIEKIIIPELGNRRILDLEKIIAIEADGAYSKIYMIDNEKHLVSKNLKYFEKKLDGISYFFRCHRGFIINLNHLKSLNKSEYSLYLESDLKVKISRAYLNELSDVLLERN